MSYPQTDEAVEILEELLYPRYSSETSTVKQRARDFIDRWNHRFLIDPPIMYEAREITDGDEIILPDGTTPTVWWVDRGEGALKFHTSRGDFIFQKDHVFPVIWKEEIVNEDDEMLGSTS